MEKTCGVCKTIKDISFFYKRKRNENMLSGYSPYCKECDRKRMYAKRNYKEYYKKNREKELKRKEMQHNKDRKKHNARVLLKHYIKKGIIKKPKDCTFCKKETTLYAHHWNYEKPIDILFVCKDCHGLLHRKVDNLSILVKELL